MVAGPSVAGLVIAKYGVVITYFMDFATFLISFLSLFMKHNLPTDQIGVAACRVSEEGLDGL
ncbi:MAG: hypothetical protein NTZ86_09705 [Legionellales bacterium]|nr:hypothetical protein [Legionellales bacterium]